MEFLAPGSDRLNAQRYYTARQQRSGVINCAYGLKGPGLEVLLRQCKVWLQSCLRACWLQYVPPVLSSQHTSFSLEHRRDWYRLLLFVACVCVTREIGREQPNIGASPNLEFCILKLKTATKIRQFRILVLKIH